MTEPTPAQTPPPVQEPVAPAAPQAPPWGTDFDAEKAWSLVQNLRADKERLASRPTLSDDQQKQLNEYQSLVEASKSEQQRKDEALAQSQREADAARADATRYKVAATYGIAAEHFDLLGSGDEAAVTERAQKIAALVASTAPTPPAAPPSGRPLEQLRPGATPAGVVDEDEAVYQALFPSK